MRVMENFTSSAVKSEPSWNFTFGRSLNSQVVGSTAFQLVARRGSISSPSPDQTSVSNTCLSVSAWVPVAVKCGSIESGPPRTPMVRVWAVATLMEAAKSPADVNSSKRFACHGMFPVDGFRPREMPASFRLGMIVPMASPPSRACYSGGRGQVSCAFPR